MIRAVFWFAVVLALVGVVEQGGAAAAAILFAIVLGLGCAFLLWILGRRVRR